MKSLSILVAFGITLFLACTAWSAPHLVCDPYPISSIQPDWFNVSVNGGSPEQSAVQTLGDGSRRLYYDLGFLAPGQYHFEISAVKDYGVEGVAESGTTPFDYTKPVVEAPGKPSGVHIE